MPITLNEISSDPNVPHACSPLITFRISFSASTSASFSLSPSLLLSTCSLRHFRLIRFAIIRSIGGSRELVLPALAAGSQYMDFSMSSTPTTQFQFSVSFTPYD
jgi:hypothetical protein